MGRKKLIGCIGVLLCLLQGAQAQNLLANGDFEEENICTEYHQNCAPEAWICSSLVSDYFVYEPSYAYSGTHFLGLIIGNQNRAGARTFVRSRLLCALRKGKQYQIKFYTRSWHNADSLGIYFSSTDFLSDTRPYRAVTPSVWIRDSMAHRNSYTTFWARHTLIYTATGDEIFFTLGGFKRNEYRFANIPDRKLDYYVYMDQLSITPLDPNEKLCSGADSVKQVLYGENERHGLLDRKIYASRKAPQFVPLPPATVLNRIDTLIIPDVLFAIASADLDQQGLLVLDSFSRAISMKRIDSLVFEGHTDSVGTFAYNRQLAANRATNVATYVQQKAHTPEARIQVHSYAYLRPRATNATPQGRQKNRRVEVYLYTHE